MFDEIMPIKASSNESTEWVYDDKYCKDVMDYITKGNSIFTLSAGLRMPDRILKEWAEQHLKFKDTLDIACSMELENWFSHAASALQQEQSKAVDFCKFMIDKLTTFKDSLPAFITKLKPSKSEIITDKNFDLADKIEQLNE